MTKKLSEKFLKFFKNFVTLKYNKNNFKSMIFGLFYYYLSKENKFFNLRFSKINFYFKYNTYKLFYCYLSKENKFLDLKIFKINFYLKYRLFMLFYYYLSKEK